MRNNHHFEARSFTAIRNQIKQRFLTDGRPVHPLKWQGIDVSQRREAAMTELLNVTFTLNLTHPNLEAMQNDIKPNLPWADDHFNERVCGVPINPGIEWANWPWGSSAEKSLNDEGQFNHNYMERLWPRYAGAVRRATKDPADWEHAVIDQSGVKPNQGIRGNCYGELTDVIELIRADPLTRQAWIPLFFPEDTGVGDGGRKPCTLGYQFILRDEAVHIYYPLRSCDFAHHMRDDIYLAVRLLMWIKELAGEDWKAAKLGSYSMHCTSLHMFANDYHALKQGKLL